VIRAPSLEEITPHVREAGFVLIGADATSRRPLDSVDLTRRVAFVVGNEAWGLPSDMRHLLDEDVGIPMPGPVESLNVGIAGSILLFETVRQRRLSSPPQ
jgi:TrmH family RNA methyltransferase